MKIDSHLTLVKRATASSRPAKINERPAPTAPPEVLHLVSRENHEAGQLSPASLAEAKQLLENLRIALQGRQEDLLAAAHHLQGPLVIRLIHTG